jgi:CheY-like chemotaxis protein
MRVLVFDDGLMAAALAKTLADAGQEVFGPVTSANEAIALVAEKKPQLAFIDINPQGSGSGRIVARHCDQVGIPTMFLMGANASDAECGSGPALFSAPEFLKNLVQVVQYVQSEGRSMLPASLQLTIPEPVTEMICGHTDPGLRD